jgi:hypothetical protein
VTERFLIILVRLTAVLLVVFGVPLLWSVMLRLTWQVDCLIAALASVLFAYAFERQEER